MVAYSFQRRFARDVERGIKTQTCRGNRKRHARPGEVVQLYEALRTKWARKLGEGICTAVEPIFIDPGTHTIRVGSILDSVFTTAKAEEFARKDGFAGLSDMMEWWRTEHGPDPWNGVLISWKPRL